MNGGILGKILAKQVDEPSVLSGLLSYRKASKELKNAIDYRIAMDDTDMLYREMMGEGAHFGEDGISTQIPRIHVDDLKEFGYDTEIPNRYKRRTGKRDIDELAGFAGFTEAGGDRGVDGYLEQITSTLKHRKAARDRLLDIRDKRNDPEFISQVQKDLEAEKAMYAPPEVFEPSKRDLQWYIKNVAIPKSKVTQIEVKSPPKTGMENFKINRNDISYAVPESVIKYIPSNHQIPVRNLSPKPIAQPAPTPSVVPLNGQPMQQSPDWRESLANILTLQTAMGAQ